jgi:hypothetical protein
MKKLFVVLSASLICITAFAQGKVSFSNDSLHLVYWGPTAGPLFGTAVNSDNMPPGIFGMQVDLYMGTSSSQLFLYTSTTFGPLAAGPGKWPPVNLTLNGNPATGAPALPAGTTVFVEIGVHSQEKAPGNIFDAANLLTFQAHGQSVEFTFLVPSGVTYPPLWGINGNWPPGTFNMDQYGVGSRGAIQVDLIPEPSTLALASLGGVGMLFFCRRK